MSVGGSEVARRTATWEEEKVPSYLADLKLGFFFACDLMVGLNSVFASSWNDSETSSLKRIDGRK